MAVVVEKTEHDALAREVRELRGELEDLRELLDTDIKGSKAAAAKAGISVRTLELERDRPDTVIEYKKVGRSVSYSLASLIAYRKAKRIPKLQIAS
ncbi:hypothetical protein [Pontibacter mangrovi]|uniref:DNA-binding protein n=1 Tax=Pontibacter mangrovi TaxID=2589816 RepID=A0A501W4U2_9BACT|nr:hypothetical protein [Pontibacter mangrovi]TPE44963.1 hypothetical protein FJM65_08075 [Pontibacter mangrovi]